MEPSYLDQIGWRRLQTTAAINIASGAAAGFAVTPIVVVLDTAVTEAAFRRRTITQSMLKTISTFILQPHRAILTRPFAAIFLLYSATYMTANFIDSLSTSTTPPASADDQTQKAQSNDSETSNGWTKLGAVSAVNMFLSLNKDNQFAKAFGTSLAMRSLPLASYVPLILRDGITLYASFNVPPMLAPYLPDSCDAQLGRLATAQLLAPAASQIVVTPLHLLGLDLYHRNGRLPIVERIRGMTVGWASSSVTRMARIVPGLAFGNVLNTKIRNGWIEGA